MDRIRGRARRSAPPNGFEITRRNLLRAVGEERNPSMRSDDTPATEILGSVVKAEWRALWLPGGTCVGPIIAAAAAIATGTIALLVLNAIARGPSHVVLSAPI